MILEEKRGEVEQVDEIPLSALNDASARLEELTDALENLVAFLRGSKVETEQHN
jgi:hypothetical protein